MADLEGITTHSGTNTTKALESSSTFVKTQAWQRSPAQPLHLSARSRQLEKDITAPAALKATHLSHIPRLFMLLPTCAAA